MGKRPRLLYTIWAAIAWGAGIPAYGQEQLPYIDQLRAASAVVQEAVEQLSHLKAADVDMSVDDFRGSWAAYRGVRAEIVAYVLQGDIGNALAVEKTRGQPAFAAALEDLHTLKSGLEKHASRASQQVHAILPRSAVGLAAFATCMLLIMKLLAKANRARRQALESLAAERELEQQRASILEMVSTHAPLSGVLATIGALAPKHAAGAAAAIWAAAGEDQICTFKSAPICPPVS